MQRARRGAGRLGRPHPAAGRSRQVQRAAAGRARVQRPARRAPRPSRALAAGARSARPKLRLSAARRGSRPRAAPRCLRAARAARAARRRADLGQPEKGRWLRRERRSRGRVQGGCERVSGGRVVGVRTAVGVGERHALRVGCGAQHRAQLRERTQREHAPALNGRALEQRVWRDDLRTKGRRFPSARAVSGSAVRGQGAPGGARAAAHQPARLGLGVAQRWRRAERLGRRELLCPEARDSIQPQPVRRRCRTQPARRAVRLPERTLTRGDSKGVPFGGVWRVSPT